MARTQTNRGRINRAAFLHWQFSILLLLAYPMLNKLKERNPELQILLSVGGELTPTTAFTTIASSSVNNREFARNAISFLRDNKFDGLDIDWRLPSNKAQFTSFISVSMCKIVCW